MSNLPARVEGVLQMRAGSDPGGVHGMGLERYIGFKQGVPGR